MVGKIAVLGLGRMGGAMAHRLLGAGLTVSVWNRSRAKTGPFEDAGAQVASTAAEAVEGADVILTMLFDGPAVEGVMAGAIPAARPGAIWMQSSTVGTREAERLAQRAVVGGLRFVDAPVLGTKDPAEHGTLTALLAGDADAIAELRPVLDAIATKTVLAGPAAPAASALKLACNAWIATITAGIGQSLTIAERLGSRPELVLDALSGTAPDSPYAQLKGGAVLDGRFGDAQFEITGLLKDVRLARDETPAMARGLLDALDELYSDAVSAGHGDDDIAAVWTAFAR